MRCFILQLWPWNGFDCLQLMPRKKILGKWSSFSQKNEQTLIHLICWPPGSNITANCKSKWPEASVKWIIIVQTELPLCVFPKPCGRRGNQAMSFELLDCTQGETDQVRITSYQSRINAEDCILLTYCSCSTNNGSNPLEQVVTFGECRDTRVFRRLHTWPAKKTETHAKWHESITWATVLDVDPKSQPLLILQKEMRSLTAGDWYWRRCGLFPDWPFHQQYSYSQQSSFSKNSSQMTKDLLCVDSSDAKNNHEMLGLSTSHTS